MDAADLDSLVDDLSSNIDDLEESLAPLLMNGLSQSTSKLPLLDKAKAYVLATYALESILFSSLRLNGVDAKAHPVFQELARVKEYFGKVKAAETAGTKRSTTLDKEAANRFVKHGLAGNERYDRERVIRAEAEKAGAKRKLEDMATGTHTRFDGAAKRIKASESKQSAVQSDGDDQPNQMTAGAANDAERDAHGSVLSPSKAHAKEAKRQRRAERRLNQDTPITGTSASEDMSSSGVLEERAGAAIDEVDRSSTGAEEQSSKRKKGKRKKNKSQKLEDERAAEMK